MGIVVLAAVLITGIAVAEDAAKPCCVKPKSCCPAGDKAPVDKGAAESVEVKPTEKPMQTFVPPPPDVIAKLIDESTYKPLLEEDLSNAVFEEGGWAFEGEVLTAKGKGDIWTKERFGDFILSLEFKCEGETNSGVFFRCGDLDNWLHTCIEAQILQNNDEYENTRHHCGGIFDCLAPRVQQVKAPGEWNKYVVVAKGRQIWLLLNHELTAYMDLDQWTDPHKNPDGTKNKFNAAYKDMPREGHIGLQYHGDPIWFRNVRVETLN